MKPPSSAGWFTVEREAGDLPELQAFYEANPGYWLLVHGTPPRPDEAASDFDARPPADMPYRALRNWLVRDTVSRRLLGEVAVVEDLLAPGVMHLGFFIVEDARHGTGLAGELHRCYEHWAIARGARWLRLGVVEPNERAHRFWQRLGYREVRRRGGVDIGERTHVLIVMMKPVGPNSLADYLAAVPRDRPESQG